MILLDFALLNAFLHWKMANSNHVKKKKEHISFIKELIDQMSDDDLVSDIFCRFEIRKHDQEIRTLHADDHPNVHKNEFSNDCLNTEDMLRNLGALHVPAFDVKAKIATSQNNICFPMSTNVKSISINKITKKKKLCYMCIWRKDGIMQCFLLRESWTLLVYKSL